MTDMPLPAHAPTPAPRRRTAERYPLLVRLTHWGMAAGFLFLWASGWAMRNAMEHDSPAQEFVYDLHKSVGVTLVVLLVVRIAARVAAQAPELPATMPAVEKRAAKAGHLALYALAAMALVTGWALTDFGGHGVVWFGVPMPQVFPVRETILGVATDPLTSDIHMWLAYGLLALAVVHVAAVVKHRRKDGIDLLPRIAIRRRR